MPELPASIFILPVKYTLHTRYLVKYRYLFEFWGTDGCLFLLSYGFANFERDLKALPQRQAPRHHRVAAAPRRFGVRLVCAPLPPTGRLHCA